MGAQKHTAFDPAQAGEAMRQAFDQMRSTFDRQVGQRMGRGDVRAAILALLLEEPMHGYELIRQIESRTNGRWKPSPGSVYPTLQMLADEGLVHAETTQDRKVYSLTEEAKEEAEASAASAPWTSTSFDASGLGVVPKAAIDLAQATSQVFRSGSSAQQEEAAEVLSEARRKIYSILAQD
ncbi:PadR family transcriptional regulator [Demequina sp. NBRC 110056]|uniref:PadR family transcriptional regulator n=1 Tax=Demequina sp. NBRC 110056 TaxID=1570345 RepID=UPI001F2132AB|nr:PadR family transcriptional regulator [Demequina sp. NBRC 110056]